MSVEHGSNVIGRDGGQHGESDRAIRALTPGNAGRAKRPDFRRAAEEAEEARRSASPGSSSLKCSYRTIKSIAFFNEPQLQCQP